MELEEKINNVKREIAKLLTKKYELETNLNELTTKLKEKRDVLFELELEKKKEDMRRRK